MERQDDLPFPPTPSASIAGRTMQKSVYRQRVTPRRLAADAPNIVIMLIDDAGPALPTTFGGEVQTKTMGRIVKDGIAYNRFHSTAMCSPTRAALLTGRNHHRVGAGQIAELANDWDGYSGHIPKSSALIADVLKDYGYATAAWGKWRNTPAEETTPTGPFDNWPVSLGFEYFYGFLVRNVRLADAKLAGMRTLAPSRLGRSAGRRHDCIGLRHRAEARRAGPPS
jgi:Sulfatase